MPLSEETLRKLREDDDTLGYAARDAILAGDEDTLQRLLASGLSPNHSPPESYTKPRRSLIYLAAQSGRLNMVRLLVEYGAAFYGEYNRSRYGLAIAVKMGHADIVDYLLERGAESHAVLVMRAARDGNIRIFESLIKYYDDIPSILRFAHEKLFVRGYCKNLNAVEEWEKENEQLDPRDLSSTLEWSIPYINGLQRKADDAINSYIRIVRTCLDYAFGCDFEQLLFLDEIDVSGMNFVGVSVAGKPVTREFLAEKAWSGAVNAIVTLEDLSLLKDEKRQKALTARLEAAYAKKGKLVNDAGVVNLVPLNSAARVGDEAAVTVRLEAGVDPNMEQSALSLAAQNGHEAIVRLLFAAHANHTANKVKQLTSDARKFVASKPIQNCLSLIDGRVQELSIPFKMDKYLMIALGDKSFTPILNLFHRQDGACFHTIYSIAEYKKAKNKTFIMVIHQDDGISYIEYDSSAPAEELKKAFKEMIESIDEDWGACPFIIIHRDNFDLIEELIRAQYQMLDKGKTATFEAIEVARELKHASIVDFLEGRFVALQSGEPHELTMLGSFGFFERGAGGSVDTENTAKIGGCGLS